MTHWSRSGQPLITATAAATWPASWRWTSRPSSTPLSCLRRLLRTRPLFPPKSPRPNTFSSYPGVPGQGLDRDQCIYPPSLSLSLSLSLSPTHAHAYIYLFMYTPFSAPPPSPNPVVLVNQSVSSTMPFFTFPSSSLALSLRRPSLPMRAARWRLALRVGFPTVCFALGVWQLYRLRWKRRLIASLEEGQQLPSIPLDRLPYPSRCALDPLPPLTRPLLDHAVGRNCPPCSIDGSN